MGGACLVWNAFTLHFIQADKTVGTTSWSYSICSDSIGLTDIHSSSLTASVFTLSFKLVEQHSSVVIAAVQYLKGH